MRRTLSKWLALPAACGMLVVAGAATADTTVELRGVHLCCGACVKGVTTALKGVDGVKPKCDQKGGTVTLTAKDEAAARKALDALGAAGYYGETGNSALGVKPGAASKGKVKSLTLAGVHNCCGSCARAIKATVKAVDGVKGDTAKAKSDTFEVTGDFEPEALIKALNAAGFNATVKD